MHMKYCLLISKWNPTEGQKSFQYGEVWNSVSCHGNRIVKLVLWSTFSRIVLQIIKHLWYKLAEIPLSSYYIYIWTKCGWVYDVITWLIWIFRKKTSISLERKVIIENSEQHFSSGAVHQFMFYGFDRKDEKMRFSW